MIIGDVSQIVSHASALPLKLVVYYFLLIVYSARYCLKRLLILFPVPIDAKKIRSNVTNFLIKFDDYP